MKPSRKGLLFSLCVLVCTQLSGCSDSSTDLVQEAQTCLNTATQSTALSCEAKVAGVTSAAASYIRCAAIMIYENVVSTANLTAISQMTSTSSLSAIMTDLRFYASAGSASASNTTDLSMAQTASTECANSGSPGLLVLATMSALATVTSEAVGGCGTTITASCLTGVNAGTITTALPNTPTLLYSTYEQNCLGSSVSSADQVFCTKYSAAITASGGTSNLTNVATAFLNSMN